MTPLDPTDYYTDPDRGVSAVRYWPRTLRFILSSSGAVEAGVIRHPKFEGCLDLGGKTVFAGDWLVYTEARGYRKMTHRTFCTVYPKSSELEQ